MCLEHGAQALPVAPDARQDDVGGVLAALYIYIYIYIYIYMYTYKVHPVSITRFLLSRFSPGAGLLRNPFVYTINAKIFQGLGPKRRESCNGDRV